MVKEQIEHDVEIVSISHEPLQDLGIPKVLATLIGEYTCNSNVLPPKSPKVQKVTKKRKSCKKAEYRPSNKILEQLGLI